MSQLPFMPPLVPGARRSWGPGGYSGVRHLGVVLKVRIRMRDLSRKGNLWDS